MISSVSGQYCAKRLLDCFHTAHTHPSGGVDVPFGVMTFDLIFYLRFEAIIDFNLWRMISSVSGRYIRKRFLDCFHIACTHPSGGVDVPFGGCDL